MANEWEEMGRKQGNKQGPNVPRNEKITTADYNDGAFNLDTIHDRYLADLESLQKIRNEINEINEIIYDKYHVDDYKAILPEELSENGINMRYEWMGDLANSFWENNGTAIGNNIWGSFSTLASRPTSPFKTNHNYFVKMGKMSSYIYVDDIRKITWYSLGVGNIVKELYFLNDYYHYGVIGYWGVPPCISSYSVGVEVSGNPPIVSKTSGILLSASFYDNSQPDLTGEVFGIPITQSIANDDSGRAGQVLFKSSPVNISNSKWDTAIIVASWS